jgi:hypothetical protein
MIESPKLRVRTRLPVQAWTVAGLVTLFSIVSSLTEPPAPLAAVYANLSEAYASSIGW